MGSEMLNMLCLTLTLSSTLLYFRAPQGDRGQDLLCLLCSPHCADPRFLSGCMCRPIGLPFIPPLPLSVSPVNRPNVTDVCVRAQRAKPKHRGRLYAALR